MKHSRAEAVEGLGLRSQYVGNLGGAVTRGLAFRVWGSREAPQPTPATSEYSVSLGMHDAHGTKGLMLKFETPKPP